MDAADTVGEIAGWIGWIFAGVSTVVAALWAGILFLARLVNSMNEQQLKELKDTCHAQQEQIDECTEDRAELRVEVACLRKDVEHLKAKV